MNIFMTSTSCVGKRSEWSIILLSLTVVFSACEPAPLVSPTQMVDIFAREFNVCSKRAESVEEELLVVDCARDRARRALKASGRFNPECFDRIVGHWAQLTRKVESGVFTRQQADVLFRDFTQSISNRCT